MCTAFILCLADKHVAGLVTEAPAFHPDQRGDAGHELLTQGLGGAMAFFGVLVAGGNIDAVARKRCFQYHEAAVTGRVALQRHEVE